MTDIVVKDVEKELVERLADIAAENGQDIEEFIETTLAQIAKNHAARQKTGLASRMATRVQGVGLKEHEALATFPRQSVRNPFGDGP